MKFVFVGEMNIYECKVFLKFYMFVYEFIKFYSWRWRSLMKLCIEGGVRVGRVINECESVVYRFVM